MIKSANSIQTIKQTVQSYYLKPVTVKLNLGRNKFITFEATLDGVYPSLFTVKPNDKNFLGKTAYSYSEVMCGRVRLSGKETQAT